MPKPTPCMFRGEWYPSISAAARVHDLAVSTVWDAVDRGGDAKLVGGNCKAHVALGIEWDTQGQIAAALGVSDAAVSRGICLHGSAEDYIRNHLAKTGKTEAEVLARAGR